MFCERCGRNLDDDQDACPECGAYYGPDDTAEEQASWLFFVIPFMAAFAASAAASWFLGPYFLFFFVFFWFGGRSRTKRGMILRGIFMGAMFGALAGLIPRLL